MRPALQGAPTVELHLHTCYSFLEGASQPEELATRAARLGYRALAITDHDGLHGAMAFAQACAAVGIRPITGVELTLRHGFVEQDAGPVHLTLLVESGAGYANLCRLITRAHRFTRLRPGQVDDDVATRYLSPPELDPWDLEDYTEGLIVLTGCRSGEISRLVDAGRHDDAKRAARLLTRLFSKDSSFIELQHNLVQGDTRRMALLSALAEDLDIPVVATGNVHYHERERHCLQDALVAIRHRTTLEGSHRVRRPNSEFFLRDPEEVARLFSAYPEALRNARWIGERCKDFNLADRADMGYEFPDFDRNEDEQRSTADEVLATHCRAKLDERYPSAADPPLRARAERQLAEELEIVKQHHLSGFFLIYRDLQEMATRVAREVRGTRSIRGGAGLPPGRGRGSSVSSIICYLIGLSHVDPVKNKLFFKRFLNEDLQAVPDIDLDFSRDIREELILRVYEKYTSTHAALVCTFATYHLRSAVRDLGKVLELPPAAIDKLAKLSEGGGADTVRKELDRLPEFAGQANGPLWDHLVCLAEQLDGLPRHVGQHVGGMIISSRPLIELVPVQPAATPGRSICQWDKDSCDDARFVKIDFLALGMLSLVEECLELIWQTRGEKLDLATIAYDDPAVYQAISEGDTVGLFQIESRAQIQMLTRTRPRTLEDLAVQVAIVRPGPIVGGAVNPYVRRRERQRADPAYRPRANLPILDTLLEDTLGVVLYQDQVLEVAIRVGGFTPGQANRFRRAMSRRRSREAMESFREAFLKGASRPEATAANGRPIRREEAEALFEKLCGFSEFGFPKSHAYAFGILAYQSAYLRHAFPAEYLAALLNNQPMGFYAPHVLVGDARRHGLTVLRVSLNRSGVKSVPHAPDPALPLDRGRVLLGLTTVKGLGEDLARTLVEERDAHGPYRSLSNLLRRVELPRTVAERLIAVGALSEFGMGRRELLWQLGLLVPGGQGATRSRRRAGSVRGRQPALDLPTDQDQVRLRDTEAWERMVADYGLLGLSPSYHPMGLLRSDLPSDLRTAEDLRARTPDGARVRTAGLVVCRQRPGTARGILFLLLEDETGLTNVVVKPELYDAHRSVLRGEPYIVVEGVLQIRSGSLNLLADSIAPLRYFSRAALPRLQQRGLYPPPPGEAPTPDGAESHSPVAQDDRLRQVAPASHDFH